MNLVLIPLHCQRMSDLDGDCAGQCGSTGTGKVLLSKVVTHYRVLLSGLRFAGAPPALCQLVDYQDLMQL